MKILSTTDFSNASINSIHYILKHLEHASSGGELEILHCMDFANRSDVFEAVQEILEEKAQNDMDVLVTLLRRSYPEIVIKSSVVLVSSKAYICDYAKSIGADLIVTGTTGLTRVKNITVGSVTEFIANNSKIPVLTIPHNVEYKPIQNIMLAVGKTDVKSTNGIALLKSVIESYKSKLELVHVLKKEQYDVEIGETIKRQLKDIQYDYQIKAYDRKISYSINNYAKENDIDLIAIIHKKRSWFSNLFHHSILREELFSVNKPFLILPD